jgi:hypothetical protein
VLEAEDAALENVEEALYNAAITGNVRAAELWLNIHGRGKKRTPIAPSGVGERDDFEARLDRLDGS